MGESHIGQFVKIRPEIPPLARRAFELDKIYKITMMTPDWNGGTVWLTDPETGRHVGKLLLVEQAYNLGLAFTFYSQRQSFLRVPSSRWEFSDTPIVEDDYVVVDPTPDRPVDPRRIRRVHACPTATFPNYQIGDGNPRGYVESVVPEIVRKVVCTEYDKQVPTAPGEFIGRVGTLQWNPVHRAVVLVVDEGEAIGPRGRTCTYFTMRDSATAITIQRDAADFDPLTDWDYAVTPDLITKFESLGNMLKAAFDHRMELRAAGIAPSINVTCLWEAVNDQWKRIVKNEP